MNDLVALAWPLNRLGEAIEALARYAGLGPAAVGAETPPTFRGEAEQEALGNWIDWACARLGIEGESVETTGAEFVELLRGAGPALLQYRHAGEHYVLLLLKATARAVKLISPDLRIRKCPLGVVRAALSVDVEGPVLAEVEALLRQANIPRAELVRCETRAGARAYRGTALWRLLDVENSTDG